MIFISRISYHKLNYSFNGLRVVVYLSETLFSGRLLTNKKKIKLIFKIKIVFNVNILCILLRQINPLKQTTHEKNVIFTRSCSDYLVRSLQIR